MPTTTTSAPETRPYPYDCRSAYCARTQCDGCPLLPALNAFKAWRDERAAVVLDPNWAPLTYTATRLDRPACDCGNANAYWDGDIRREYACEDCHRASTAR